MYGSSWRVNDFHPRRIGCPPFAGSIVASLKTRATDLWFPVPDVSKYHAYFELIDSRYAITDTGSKNGTYVNSERLKPRIPFTLEDTAMLRFGGCDARFCSPTGFFHYLTKYI